MSNDLISRKSVIQAVDRHTTEDGKLDEGISVILEDIQTTYDVDVVCKELDKASDYYETEEQGKEHVQMVNLADAIEIVRNGGMK